MTVPRQLETAVLLGELARRNVMPIEVAFEILGATMNGGQPRLSRLREWLEDDETEALQEKARN